MVTKAKPSTKNKHSIAGQTKGVGKGRVGNYILFNSGQRFWPFDPRPEELNIEDIAHSLSRQSRFTGHTNGEPYSVADHSLRVAWEIQRLYDDPQLTKTALLHDGSEAILVDLPRPIKSSEGLGRIYKEIEGKIEECIAERYDLIYPFPKEVMDMDAILLITEQRDLMPWPEGEKPWFPELVPLEGKIVPLNWKDAKKEFLEVFAQLEG